MKIQVHRNRSKWEVELPVYFKDDLTGIYYMYDGYKRICLWTNYNDVSGEMMNWQILGSLDIEPSMHEIEDNIFFELLSKFTTEIEEMREKAESDEAIRRFCPKSD